MSLIFNIRPQSTVKGQVLANFIVECTIPDDGSILKSLEDINSFWILHMDGALNSQKSNAGLILLSPEGFITEQVLRFNFNIFNNDAKYKALTIGLKMTKEFGVKKLKVFSDSQLIIGQVWNQFKA